MTKNKPSVVSYLVLPLSLILLFSSGVGIYQWGVSEYSPEPVREFFAKLSGAPSTPRNLKASTPPSQADTPPPVQYSEPAPKDPLFDPPAAPESNAVAETDAPWVELEQEQDQEARQAPVAVSRFEYNKAVPAAGLNPISVRGTVQIKEPVDTDNLYGSSESRTDAEAPLPAVRGEDPMVRLDFVQAMARYLARNYWPSDSHPAARGRGITTAGTKLTNLTFGVPMRGFGVSPESGPAGRKRVLDYAMNKEMLNALYTLYGKRFFSALAKAADERRIPDENGRPLTPAERSEMYALYAERARALAGVIRACCAAPDLDERITAYTEAEEQVYTVYEQLLNQPSGANRSSLQSAYQQATVKRDQAREMAASSLRRAGDTKGMDTDSLVYIAAWLNRRGFEKSDAFQAMADTLDRVAAQLDKDRATALEKGTHTALQ